jgi:hypothetical protein
MTDSEKMEKLIRSASLGDIAQLKEDLLTCPIVEQVQKLDWLSSAGLTEHCELKSMVTDQVVMGEAIRFNNAIIFFPFRTEDGVFKIGNNVIDFNKPTQLF